MPYVFLSPEWIETAEQIYERHGRGGVGRPVPAVVVNLVVTGAPFAPGAVEAHTDTTSGELLIRRGNAAAPDLTVRLDYETARSLVIDQDPQLAIEALILGRVRIEGDVAALSAKTDLDLTQLPGLWAAGLAEELRAITA